MITRLELAKQVAMSFLGKPYIWGGDDPMRGFDCSGFCVEILKSIGALPRQGDWTADGLYNFYKNCEKPYPDPGYLVFWGRLIKTHVEFCLNENYSIGASGGGSKTITEAEAIKQNAYIKIRPIDSRSEQKYCVNPFKFDFYD